MREFDWSEVDARIRRLEALADRVRDFYQGQDFGDFAAGAQRILQALKDLDRTAIPRRTAYGPWPARPTEDPPDVSLQADLSRRKRIYQALLRNAQDLDALGTEPG